MGERRAGRFRVGRRRSADERSAEAEVPCVPCGQQAALRAFTLNPDATVDGDLVPVLAPDVAHAITDGEVVLFHPNRSTSTLLNSSAALIWASIDGVATVDAIIDDLAEETGTDRSIIATDVRDAIARFIHGGIVEVPREPADEPAPPRAVASGGDDESPLAERERRRAQRVDDVLERRDWCLTDQRRCAGASVVVRTDSPELAELLGPALAHLGADDSPPVTTVSITDRGHDTERRFRILRGSAVDAFARTADDAFDIVFTMLNDIAINSSPGRIVLHAGAVERDGAIVVVAGPSGRGKSTHTAALVQRGFGYLTDEVVAIDPETLGVLPYPKPFDLDHRAAALLGIDATRDDGVKGKVGVDRLGHVSSGDGSVRLIVLLDDPDRPAPPPTAPAAQLIELLANTFASTFQPGSGPAEPLEALSSMTRRVEVVHLGRASVDDACRAIDDRLRSIDLAPAS